MYLAYQFREGVTDPHEFQGVFSSRKKAIAACRNANYYIRPVTLNKSLPARRIKYLVGDEWPLMNPPQIMTRGGKYKDNLKA